MLSQQTIATVKATAPILEEQGESLTRHFYQRMFSHNPEVKPYFNPSHQAAGRQQKALAAAICAYAANIDRLEVLGSAVELIAQKHASLQIKPEHYPIVGEHLLASIREVLGAAATDDIIDAWAEAYTFLAKILMGRGKAIYDSQDWDGFKSFRLVKKVVESDVISSFHLVPADGSMIPRFKAGQYITIRVPTADGSTTMRNYSLSDRPDMNWLRISVKQEGFVSNFLHTSFAVGDCIDVGFPCGEFVLNDASSKPLVLLAAGVGITPLYSMLRMALESAPEREIILIQASVDEGSQAFKKDIDALLEKFPNLKVHYRYSAPQGVSKIDHASEGFVDGHLLNAVIHNRDADYYFCGPAPFMHSIQQQLTAWSIPSTQIHSEFFGPKL